MHEKGTQPLAPHSPQKPPPPTSNNSVIKFPCGDTFAQAKADDDGPTTHRLRAGQKQ